MTNFTTKDGRVLTGKIVQRYPAFEGGWRYIFQTEDGNQYRCVEDENGNYVEYVA